MNRNLDVAALMRENRPLTSKEKLMIVGKLSIPAILANISEITMQYIDASMVGTLGANASASIGLVTSSTWLIGGLIIACSYGFSVQVAQATGAADYNKTHHVFKQSLIIASLFGILLGIIGVLISPHLPVWLNGSKDIIQDSTAYFMIFCAFIPIRQLNMLGMAMLQCTGNMKTPSALNALACLLDIVFNFFLIFPTRTIHIFHYSFTAYGFNLGVKGAALGTAFAFTISCLLMLKKACFETKTLNIKDKGPWALQLETLQEALHIAIPMAIEQSALALAQIISIGIVAPLGNIALAAHSFADTAEALCYMPGYGIGAAATTLIGQAIGAKRKDLAKSFAWLTTFTGMTIMGLTAFMMYFICPSVFSFLTPVIQVQQLGIECLRIELWAEPLFAASIIACGALRGAGDTLIPAILNLVSIWGIRIPLGAYLVSKIGLQGMWIAMCLELNIRGTIFLVRLKKEKWLEKLMANEGKPLIS